MFGKTILTGSRVYGQPSLTSDVDMVVLMSDADLTTFRGQYEALMNLSDEVDEYHGSPSVTAMARLYPTSQQIPTTTTIPVWNALNLIICTTEEQFEVWYRGTEKLKDEARASPLGYVTRDRAVEVFQELERELL